ncbi:Ig-like domain-containing protein, partial [Limnovirga soli]|uniref:Ig-like domain-containing protein n=1 Tax=Limnovirga soli TaxID=2656915 RepID=UPI001492C9C4
TVINAAGCSDSVSKPIVVSALPVIAPITGPDSVCVGHTINLSEVTAGGSWLSNNSGIATITNTGLVTGISAGTVRISYTVINAAGCSDSVSKTIVVSALPVIAPIAGPDSVCVGHTINLSEVTAGGSWLSNNSGIVTISSGGLITGISAGTVRISYTVINAAGCSDSVSKTIVVSALPVIAPITGPDSVCVGHTINLSEVTAGGSWLSNNIGIAT